MSFSNPYADLRALLDVTRQLTPEEMAELHLEQGYVDRALRIYEELLANDPTNGTYAMRRAWLARMAVGEPVRIVGSKQPIEPAAPAPPATSTLEGMARAPSTPEGPVRPLRIVGVR